MNHLCLSSPYTGRQAEEWQCGILCGQSTFYTATTGLPSSVSIHARAWTSRVVCAEESSFGFPKVTRSNSWGRLRIAYKRNTDTLWFSTALWYISIFVWMWNTLLLGIGWNSQLEEFGGVILFWKGTVMTLSVCLSILEDEEKRLRICLACCVS